MKEQIDAPVALSGGKEEDKWDFRAKGQVASPKSTRT